MDARYKCVDDGHQLAAGIRLQDGAIITNTASDTADLAITGEELSD